MLSAGEMSFREESGRWMVDEVSNQSTGYCPDVGSWSAVADALDRAGFAHPGGFTHGVVFRRCVACQQVNIVREDDFTCVFCDESLPFDWNVDQCEPGRGAVRCCGVSGFRLGQRPKCKCDARR